MSFGASNPFFNEVEQAILFKKEVEQAIFGLPCIWHGLISELMSSSSHLILIL
jgi:hypothetical protein